MHLRQQYVSRACCTLLAAGESDSDQEENTAVTDTQSFYEPTAAADDTLTAGSTSTAQLFTDAGTSYDDIDTDAPQQLQTGPPRPRGSLAQDNTTRTTQTHADGSSDASSPQLDDCMGDQAQRSIQMHHSDRGSDAHSQAIQAASGETPYTLHADATQHDRHRSAPSAAAGANEANAAAAVQADGQGQQGRPPAAMSQPGAPAAFPSAAPVAEEEGQDLTQLPAGATNPGVAAPTLASNRAFQQELQRRSGERQARAGALMTDAAAREVAGGEAASAQTHLR